MSIDEAMICFDGSSPKKSVKCGIKLWCSCDANIGYCVVFKVYTGAEINPNAALFDLSYCVVKQLMRHSLLSYHHVYADNYFTSVFLAEDLLDADTYLRGTIRPSRRAYPVAL